jgi:hypothetical protein
MRHLFVSLSGDPYGVVDDALARRGLSRRVALTVASFMMALWTLAETDLLGTVPRHLVTERAEQFGLVTVDLPVLRRRDPAQAVATKAAIMHAGIAWLFALLKDVPWDTAAASSRRRRRRPIALYGALPITAKFTTRGPVRGAQREPSDRATLPAVGACICGAFVERVMCRDRHSYRC